MDASHRSIHRLFEMVENLFSSPPGRFSHVVSHHVRHGKSDDYDGDNDEYDEAEVKDAPE